MRTAPSLMRRRLKRRKCCSEKGQSPVLQLLLLTFAREITLNNCQFRVGSTSSGLYKKLFILTLVCRWECISSDSSNLLLSLIRPKLVLSGWNHHMTQNSLFWLWLSLNIPGHTHHGCNTSHGQGIFYSHGQLFFSWLMFFIFMDKDLPSPPLQSMLSHQVWRRSRYRLSAGETKSTLPSCWPPLTPWETTKSPNVTCRTKTTLSMLT